MKSDTLIHENKIEARCVWITFFILINQEIIESIFFLKAKFSLVLPASSHISSISGARRSR